MKKGDLLFDPQSLFMYIIIFSNAVKESKGENTLCIIITPVREQRNEGHNMV